MSWFPTGVSVVTSVDTAGRPHGMTCTSLCSVSTVPPTLLISLHLSSGTYRAVCERGLFGLNLLHADGRAAAELFASATPDRFGQINWRASPVIGVPWLRDHAFAIAECQAADIYRASDHGVIFAEVLHITQRPDAPLLYGGRRYATWRD